MNPRFNNFSGRGFPLVPFVLGGVVGSLWANNNRNNYYPYPVYYYPYPYYPYNRYY